jgi:very-short-patch-repair endonuclease
MQSAQDIDKIVKLYDEGKSPYEIAELYKTYPNKIRRILKKYRGDLRTKSEAQSIGMKSGRIPHPTKGKKLSESAKIKISEKVHEYWQNISEDELSKHVERSRARWNNLSVAARKDMQDKALDGIRRTIKEGSRLERAVLEAIQKAGFSAEFHRKNLVLNEKLEADIYISSLNTIIEIDGPSHFLPIWGEDKLKQTMKADAEKAGLAISRGFVVVRIKCLADTILERHKRQAIELVLKTLNAIKQKTPDKKKRYIELEIDE